MHAALRPSQRIAVMGVITPQSATTIKSTAWVDASTFQNFLAIVQTGVMTATGTLDATIQQASDSSGTGAKALATALSITQLLAASGSGLQALINFKQDDIDVTNGFKFIRLNITPATAASLIGGLLLGVDARYGPADLLAAATQTQIVGP